MNDVARFVVLSVTLVGLAGCVTANGSAVASTRVQSTAPKVYALQLRPAATPPLRVPHYRTTGSYPQVYDASRNMTLVNAALRGAVLREQARYAPDAREKVTRLPNQLVRKYPGVFETTLQRRLVSASSTVVSYLLPTLELYPGGNDGSGWISATVRVPTGDPVRVQQLFAEPARGLQAVAFAVRKILFTNRCVRESFDSPIGADEYAKSLAPAARNYRHFALTTRGLVIGFHLGQVAGPPCGAVEALVAYTDLDAYWSSIARRLIAGVRRPR